MFWGGGGGVGARRKKKKRVKALAHNAHEKKGLGQHSYKFVQNCFIYFNIRTYF